MVVYADCSLCPMNAVEDIALTTHQALVLLLIALGALFMPLLSERIGWFTAPCEALYGAVVATFVPDVRAPGTFITSLAQFAFLFLMFLAGLEIDFSLLRTRGSAGLLRAASAAVGIQVIALWIVIVLGLPPITFLLAGALSISLLLVVMQQEGMSQTEFGQSLLVIAAIGEFLSIIELTGYDLASRYGLGWPLALAAVKLAVLLAVGYVALRALTHLSTQRPGRFARLFVVRDVTEVGVRAAFAMMLCFAAIAVLLRVEQILATFIAGVVCSYAFRRQHIVARKLTTFGQGFFLPIFFVTVGMSMNLPALAHLAVLARIGELLIAIALARLLCAPLLVLAGMTWRQAGVGALLLSAPLTLLVAIAQVGVALGQFSPTMQNEMLGAAIAGAVVFPLCARPFMRLMARREQRRAGPSEPLWYVETEQRAAI